MDCLVPDLQNIVHQFQADDYVYLVYGQNELIGCFNILSSAIESALALYKIKDQKNRYDRNNRKWIFPNNVQANYQTITMRRIEMNKDVNDDDVVEYRLSYGLFFSSTNQLGVGAPNLTTSNAIRTGNATYET